MSKYFNIESYQTWSIPKKLEFFDRREFACIDGWEEKKVISFLKFFILNQNENTYIIRKALSLYIDLTLLERISYRHTLNLLIDGIAHVEDIFIQVDRLRFLLLFYELESNTIIEIFEKNSQHEDAEIRCESLYSLGIIYFLKANKASNENNFELEIKKSINFFRKAHSNYHNRTDALFFLLITEIIQASRINPFFNYDYHLRKIAQTLWNYRLFSLSEKELYLKEQVYLVILNLVKITKEVPSNWLQYKDEFNKLCLAYYDFQNIEIKQRLLQTSLVQSLKDNLIKSNLEPYFKINSKALEAKIRVYLSSPAITDDEKSLLGYILSLSDNAEAILKESISVTKKCLQKIFPSISKERIDSLIDGSSNDSLQLITLKAFEELGQVSFENLYDKLIFSLIQLQGNISFKGKLENEKNTFIKSMLTSAGFNILDQTLWGSSNAGKTAGELDIMVLDHNQLPFAIIEALILNSLKKNYLSQHIDKIYKYDTAGLQNNVILVYSEAKNYLKFCTNYFSYIQTYSYPYKKLSCEQIDCMYSEIKIYRTTLERSDMPTNLYHLVINLAN